MGEENRSGRDYLAGSAVAGWFARSAQWFFRETEGLFGGLLGWKISPRALSACLAAGILSNALVLILLRREITSWGVLLRGAGLAVALVGLFGPKDWRSVQESSLLMRLIRRSDGHG